MAERPVRRAQAHARLMWRGSVERRDAVYAVLLMESGGGTLRAPSWQRNPGLYALTLPWLLRA